MAPDPFPLHHRSEALLSVDAARLFAHLDDHRRLASHMERPSLMTAGASMRIVIDDRHGQAVGSVIRMSGSMLGLRLSVEETVIRRDPPREKVWETTGEPRLLVIGAYRMGFTIAPTGTGTRLSSPRPRRVGDDSGSRVPRTLSQKAVRGPPRLV